MFHIGQQVIVRHAHHKVKMGAIGTVIGYYRYYDDDEGDVCDGEWMADTDDLLIQFDYDPNTMTPYRDWDNEADQSHPLGTYYIDAYHLEEHFVGDRMEFKRQAVENRHNEYKKRMLL